MFKSIPPNADVTNDGKLLIVDSVVPADARYDPSKVMDLVVVLFSGGRERTEKEFSGLFAASGWRLNRIIPTASPLSIIEGVPV
jgi:hypothetical protein